MTETFTLLPPMAVPRNYHSVALLLPDARVISAGGGLCGSGCAANHPDVQILDAALPAQRGRHAGHAPGDRSARQRPATHGTRIGVTHRCGRSTVVLRWCACRRPRTRSTTTSAASRSAFTIDRQQRLSADHSEQSGRRAARLLHAVRDERRRRAVGGPHDAADHRQLARRTLDNPGDQTHVLNVGVSLATSASGATAFSGNRACRRAQHRSPPPAAISGTTTQAGRFAVTLVGIERRSARPAPHFVWQRRNDRAATCSHVRLEALIGGSGGNPWTSMAEFNLLDQNGAAHLPQRLARERRQRRDGGENGAAANAIDGNAATSGIRNGSRHPPHAALVHGRHWRAPRDRRLPLPATHWRSATAPSPRGVFCTSDDGVNWTSRGQRQLRNARRATTTEKTVLLRHPRGPESASDRCRRCRTRTRTVGQSVSTGAERLGPGRRRADLSSHRPATGPVARTGMPGVISGTPSGRGTYTVSVQVSDGRGGVAQRQSFTGAVTAPR